MKLPFAPLPAYCDFSESAVRVLALRSRTVRGERVLEIAGYGECPAAGYRDGRFINLSDAAECVYAAAREASRSAGRRIRRLTANLDDPFLEGVEVDGVAALEKGAEGFAPRHIDEALERARQAVRPSNKHLVYQGVAAYFVDGGDSLADPIGVFGKELRVVVYLLFSDSEHAQNMKSLMRRAGMVLEALHPSGAAAWSGVVPTQDRQAGCLVITARPKVCHVVRASASAVQSYRSCMVPEGYSAGEIDQIVRLAAHPSGAGLKIFLTGEKSEGDELAAQLGDKLGQVIYCAGAPLPGPAYRGGRYAVLAGLNQSKARPAAGGPTRVIDTTLVRRITTRAKSFVQEYF